jgi:hypothetical protein
MSNIAFPPFYNKIKKTPIPNERDESWYSRVATLIEENSLPASAAITAQAPSLSRRKTVFNKPVQEWIHSISPPVSTTHRLSFRRKSLLLLSVITFHQLELLLILAYLFLKCKYISKIIP